jgi:diacylglycerol O-acyltransferase / wax synthase
MDRLGPLDALFVNAEDGVTHMHIGSCAVFAGPPPAFADIVALVESKLPLLPRYRQKLRIVPGGLTHPVWVDDSQFHLGYHVRHSALPPPGGEAELEHLMGRLMSQELDRDRPLWEAWVVEGLSDGRWALVSKVHHCMVDGVSGTDMMAVLLDRSPDTTTARPAPWTPSREPTDAELVLGAAWEIALLPMRQMSAVASSLLSPRTALRQVADAAAGIRSLARYARPAPSLSIEGAIGPHRRYAAARCTLDDAKVVRGAFGESINDVVLAAVAGAFRDVLAARGDALDDVTLRTLVPASVRAAGDTTPNNQVSMMIAELPVAVADPLRRLTAVHAGMIEAKAAHQIEAGAAVTSIASFTPPVLQAVAVRAATATLRRMPQHNINTVTTNVPGPQHPLYALGREMLEYLPFVPITYGMRIGVAIVSYNGRLAFGLTGDYDSVPDLEVVARGIEAGIAELLHLAG